MFRRSLSIRRLSVPINTHPKHRPPQFPKNTINNPPTHSPATPTHLSPYFNPLFSHHFPPPSRKLTPQGQKPSPTPKPEISAWSRGEIMTLGCSIMTLAGLGLTWYIWKDTARLDRIIETQDKMLDNLQAQLQVACERRSMEKCRPSCGFPWRRVVKPWVGLKFADDSVKEGNSVAMVSPRSPADGAGFRAGDLVIEIDGLPAGSIKEIKARIEERVGMPVQVVVRRGDKLVTLTLVPEDCNLYI